MDDVLTILEGGEGVMSYLALALSAALEYVFPPFPGDTITLFGAFLVATRGWNAAAVLAAVTAGSLVGATVDYYIGVGLARRVERPKTWLGRYWHRMQRRVEPVAERLRTRGAAYIVVNRFLPGIRALFFVAAGMASLPLGTVLFYAAISALLWNILIIVVGAAIGASWDRLLALFETYTVVVWVALGVAALSLVLWRLRRRPRAASHDDPEG